MEEQISDVDPANQFLAPEKVISEMAHVGAQRASERSWPEVLLLSTMAGGLITAGALFSTLIARARTTRDCNVCSRASASRSGSSRSCSAARSSSPR
jgi:hypothetical protein